MMHTRHCLLSLFIVLAVAWAEAAAITTIITLKNGMELPGTPGKVSSLGDDVLSPTGGGAVDVKLIVVVDDGLRRTFVSTYQVESLREDIESRETIRLKQRVAPGGNTYGRIGVLLRTTPWDAWGRRTVTIMTPKGPEEIIQGITEITPLWTRLQSLQSRQQATWDMRIATSSIPREQLSEILGHHLDLENPDDRLKIARLFLQSERYGDAENELRDAVRDFPELANLQTQLKELAQLRARQQLGEIRLRRDAGQHALVAHMLREFPTAGVAGETLRELDELSQEYARLAEQGKRAFELLAGYVAALDDGPRKTTLNEFREELQDQLSYHTLPRMADFLRLADDEKLAGEQKLALALSGWLLSGNATENLAVAISLWEVRALVREYVGTADAMRRGQILEELKSQEAGTPAYVAQLLSAMTPPKPPIPAGPELPPDAPPESGKEPAPAAGEPGSIPGYLELSIPGVDAGETLTYHVQLPPAYDPYRKYPAVVTLHSGGTTPQMQIDWWAGGYDPQAGMRLGQASRHGYLVVAPQWTSPGQRRYEYTAREHAAVLFSLRDACQRFSIDSDRVFLSGHSVGGDAAWDMALAHPDLWAGVIPISASAEYGAREDPKYVSQYWRNARHMAFYFVGGALDGECIDRNSRDFDRYLTRTGIDAMIVEYLGRGHEHFHDEIQRIFTWMGYHRRFFFPRKFEVATMRPLDNFFWWLEVHNLPSGSMVSPAAWAGNKARPTLIEGSVREKKNVVVKTGAANVTVWLTPEMVDLDQGVQVIVNGKTKAREVTPSVAVMLEDARTRGDRQHPFWAKVEAIAGRRR